MDRFAQTAAAGLLLAAAVVLAACSNSASGLTTGTTDGDAPGGITNDNPLARPIGVAWTSARAQRCGFFFDPAKLRSSYLAYEARQSNAEGLAKAEKSYDTTFKTIKDRIGGEPDYCTDAKGATIKADLQRHLAGDFSSKFPQPKKVESCGFFGCAPVYSEPINEKKFWQDQERKRPN